MHWSTSEDEDDSSDLSGIATPEIIAANRAFGFGGHRLWECYPPDGIPRAAAAAKDAHARRQKRARAHARAQAQAQAQATPCPARRVIELEYQVEALRRRLKRCDEARRDAVARVGAHKREAQRLRRRETKTGAAAAALARVVKECKLQIRKCHPDKRASRGGGSAMEDTDVTKMLTSVLEKGQV